MPDQHLYRVLESRIAIGAGGAEVVQATQDVVMPTRWEGKAGHPFIGNPAGPMGSVEMMLTEELPAAFFGRLDV
jgi:hypothetical protein